MFFEVLQQLGHVDVQQMPLRFGALGKRVSLQALPYASGEEEVCEGDQCAA